MNSDLIQRDIRHQGVGAIVTEYNKQNLLRLTNKLHQIDLQNELTQARIGADLDQALKYVKNVSDFVGSPERILGSPTTKHGEIAEQANVWFNNAERAVVGKDANATFEGVGRTAPEDYLVDGIKVQSKYINGSNNSLQHVIEHLNKYESINFGRDDSFYVIPKDQYSIIQKVLNGENTELSSKSINAIKRSVEQIERLTGKSFSDAVRPGNVDYAEVQQGAIHKTIEKEIEGLNRTSQERSEAETEKSNQKKQDAQQAAKPSLKGAAKAGGVAAAISGGLTLSIGIFRKCKSGKKLTDFSTSDWKELGVDTAKAAAEGGISGFALYGVSNFTSIPVPLASAGVSFAFSLAELSYKKYNGQISSEEFSDGCKVAAIHAAVSALGAAIGQELIPIPWLGAVIGSFLASKAMETLCGDGFERAVAASTQAVLDSARFTQDMLSALQTSFSASKRYQLESQTTLRRIEKGESDLNDALSKLNRIMEDF